MNIKVANITLDGRVAGPQNQIIQVAEGLKKHSIDTVVFLPKQDSDIVYSKLVERNTRVKRLTLHHLTTHKPHLIAYVLFFLPELFSLYRHLRREKITLVHCNGAWQIKGVIAGKMAGAKVIWHLQDTCTPRTINMLFKVIAYSFCDGLIFSGKSVKDSYLNGNGLGTNKIAQIQAPVDTSYFNPDHVPEDNAITKPSGITITTVGYINPVKGIEYFIKMANLLNTKYKHLHFYIVGPHLESQSNYAKKLAQLINRCHLKNVHFYGMCENVPAILNRADIYVCSSVTEASPMSVWEAMAMRKAIVSTDVGDVRRFIKDGENGFIVPPQDPEALAEKVSLLIEDKGLRNSFGKRARAVAVRELDVEICALRHRDFYFEVLEGVNTL